MSVTPLARIENPKGDLYHALKSSEDSFSSFGEAYFTTVGVGEVKGWKRHSVMRLNLVVPAGSVTFCVREPRSARTASITIDSANYVRLTVEPGLWMAFKGNGQGLNLVLNLASIEHDPSEVESADLDTFDFVEDESASGDHR